MKLALSTNWCNLRIERGEEIAEKALELGFDALELGFHTTSEQAKGFLATLDILPVESVHAFVPVPISAPQGYPELYLLASFDEEERKMAFLQIKRTLQFASDMGAASVVLHAGRVTCDAWFEKIRRRRRKMRGERMLEIFRRELERLVPELERFNVTLGLENLPYFEGFPNESELVKILSDDYKGRVKGWYDTGHAHVRVARGWTSAEEEAKFASVSNRFAGMHLNDVMDRNDDHLAPGFGKVDFAGLRTLAESVRHVVFEPNSAVTEDQLRSGLSHIRECFSLKSGA